MILDGFWSDFGSPEPRKTLKNFRKTDDVQCFRDVAIQPSKETKKPPKGAPREPNITPRSAPGRPGSDPRRHHELPGTPQERPKERPKRDQEPPKRPGRPQERPRSYFGAFFEPPGLDFPPIPGHFGTHFGVFLIPPALLFCSVPLVLVLGAAKLIRVGGCPR